jgi:hypothetical protein
LKKDKVFIISLPKAATSSTSCFIEQYEYKTLHWIGEIFLTKKFYENPKEFYVNLASYYDCVSDAPFYVLFKELDTSYPNSKFIFIDRNVDDWAISQIRYSKHKGLRKLLVPDPHAILEEEYFSNNEALEGFDRLKQNYNEHKERVLRYFANRDSLLFLEIENNEKEKRICEFLKIDYDPKIKFPKLNVFKR